MGEHLFSKDMLGVESSYLCIGVDCVPAVQTVEGHECDLSRQTQAVHLLENLGSSLVGVYYMMEQPAASKYMCQWSLHNKHLIAILPLNFEIQQILTAGTGNCEQNTLAV